MIRRHYESPLRVVCVTNESEGIDSSVDIVADREDFANVASPHGDSAPACYRRLRLFGPEAARDFGERIVSVDLDAVIVRDLRPLWDRDEDFIGWRDPMYPHQLNGSMFLIKAGSHTDIWADFDPLLSPAAATRAGYRGSDQAWITHKTTKAPRWSRADGVYSYRMNVKGATLPADARIVFFHGNPKPWDLKHDWITEHTKQ